MDLEIILSEISQTEKDKYYMIKHTWNLKKDKNELIYKIEIYSQMQLTNLQLPKGKGVGDKLEVWDQHIHTTVYKIDDKDLQIGRAHV